MNTKFENEAWEDDLRKVLGPAPEANFDTWKEKYIGDRVKPSTQGMPTKQSKHLRRLRTYSQVAAVFVIVFGLTWWNSGNRIEQSRVFAAQIPGVDAVKQITWTQVFYVRVTSEDGKRTWIEKDRNECAYQHLGKYRTTRFDELGKPRWVTISDSQANRTLAWDSEEKKAVLKAFSENRDAAGPFVWIGDQLRGKTGGTVSIHPNRQIDDKEITDVHWRKNSWGKSQSNHYYFDSKEKQLVGFISMNPGESFDPESRTGEILNPAEKNWSRKEPIGMRVTDIVLGANIDKATFSLDAPVGFSVENIAKQTVTQDEMLEFLAACAAFNDNVFPDALVRPFDSDKFNEASSKSRKERADSANRLIDICDKIKMREIYRSPISQFLEDHAVPDSFQYVGAGVKLGDTENIVCWFKPKNSAKFRIVYGDQKTNDVLELDLPIRLPN